MYQIELSPRKATPTQAKKQIAQLIYTHRCVFICLPQPQRLHLRTRVFNFGVPSPNFTATWYLSTLSSLLLSIIIITCVVWCFSYHIVLGLICSFFFFFFFFCDLWFEVWKMKAWVLIGISSYCFGFILL